MSESNQDRSTGGAGGDSGSKPRATRVDPLLGELEARVSDLTTPAAAKETHGPQPPQADELQRRRAAAELLYRQASETRQRALLEQKQVAALREQLARRDAEFEHATTELEIQRQQLESDRQQIAEQRELLSTDIESFEQQLEQQAERDAESRRVRRVGRFAIQLRAVTIALVAALAGGAAWMALHTGDEVTSVGRVRLTCLPADVSTHLAGLMSLAPVAANDPAAVRWRRAVEAGQVTIQPGSEAGMAELTVRGAGPVENESLISSAVSAYAKGIEARAVAHPDPHWQAWNAAQQELSERLGALRARLAGLEAQRETTQGADDWRDARERFDALQQAAREAGDALAAQREALQALEAQDAPRGVVTTDDFAAGLVDDPIYQQDSLEFNEQAKEYQSQFLLAQVLVSDPLAELQKAFVGLAAAVTEQLELNPPLAVRTVLEDLDSEVSDLQQLLRRFADSWEARRIAVEQIDIESDVVKMLSLRAEALDSAQRVSDEVARVAGVLRDKVRDVSSGAGAGTRETVVASVLRGEISRVDDVQHEFAKQVANLDTKNNFKLDAADRQVRSLRTRLRDRQDRVRTTLQQQADAKAKEAHEQSLSEARDSVAELDDEREAALNAVVDQLAALQDLEATSRAVTTLDAQHGVIAEQIAAAERQLAQHAQQEPHTQVDSVELVGLSHEATDAKREWQSAGIVAGVIFASCWVVSTLLLSRFAGNARARAKGVSAGN